MNVIFNKMFGKYLLVTNTASCALLMAVGDMMQQRSDFLKKHMTKKNESPVPIPIEEPILEDDLQGIVRIVSKTEVENEITVYDFERTRNMSAVGFMQGPFHHYFYAALEKYLPGKSTKSILKKTFIDQSIASPTCLGIFFFGLGAMERRNLQDINGEVRLKLFDTWKVDCMFWLPTQFINFLFVSIKYRVMYINFMTMIYDMFLSYIKYDAQFK